MLRTPLVIATALAVAFGLGILSSIYALRATVGFGAIALGPWTAFPTAQTIDADPYAKAHRARDGKLLLGGAEGLTFTAATDSANRTLVENCRYEIRGITPPARLWTLHAADRNGNPLEGARAGLPTGLNAWSVLRGTDSNFSIRIASSATPGNWLAVPEGRAPFLLVMTLLDTPTAGSSGVIDLAMPGIVRLDCADA
ncbi:MULTISPECIES: DUF1214 domain-containing protein [unclassified Shinella]|uniref:DUF1214 domain-containing protein n=1 Tax=Shinella TaxID=323620 RepID=UPI00225CCFFF|nr:MULTISPECIES: DUF1214 domain-containing protein [unclassified Shinella]CAI0336786.1 conserved hypothetical protein [Rhizobiaceae bacterium]CAK7255313.1 DUF1214 domain-containing protein [Shinella sp. WSC3-e]MCO5136246.1 DUF1214 domain-containing protein [Shinella sp.]MCW5712475.1 DUF1214 domain-containing protein [Shinella sp.]MDC7254117.1 DUF1214 domain-containing protein [Shinella sp. YE25]